MDKERELKHLLRFKEVFPYFPEGAIECTEKPDFVVQAPTCLLGIEHTEIFQPGPLDHTSLQAQDSLREKVVNKINRSFKQYTRQLFAQISFDPRVMIGKKDVDHLAKAVENLIRLTLIEPDKPIVLRRTRENSIYFPREIRSILVYCLPDGNKHEWRSFSSGTIPEVNSEYIQDIINQKEQKLDNYKSKCSEIWLLIVADNIRIPSSVDLHQVALAHKYSTKFNRVFFFWYSTYHYTELQLTSKGST